MIVIPNDLEIIEFNIEGFLNLAKDQYIVKQNNLNLGITWHLVAGTTTGFLKLIPLYEPKSKVDFSLLAVFKGEKSYECYNLNELENEKSEINKIMTDLIKEFGDEYDKRIKKTKVQVAFPHFQQESLAPLYQRISLNLHNALDRNPPLL